MFEQRAGCEHMKNTNNFERANDLRMTNEEYREELKKIFDGIEENYKLRWFYRFITEKIKGSK